MTNRSWTMTLLVPALVAVVVGACGAATPASAVPGSPSAASAAGPTPVLTAVPGGQQPGAGVPGAGLDPTEGEAMLLGGIRTDLQGSCGPVREGLPAAAVASVACAPAADGVAAVRVDIFDEPQTLLAAYAEQVRAAGVEARSNGGSCFEVESAEGAWVPGDDQGAVAERNACWFDVDGAPVYIATQPPYVLITVTGVSGSQLPTAQQYAWLGNEDVPGAPTVWREIPVDAEK